MPMFARKLDCGQRRGTEDGGNGQSWGYRPGVYPHDDAAVSSPANPGCRPPMRAASSRWVVLLPELLKGVETL